jgi:hypothetical protein
VIGEASVKRTRSSCRGSGDGTYTRELVRNKGSLRWALTGVANRQQRLTREGRSWPGQMTDGLVLPTRPGNAGGGKEP